MSKQLKELVREALLGLRESERERYPDLVEVLTRTRSLIGESTLPAGDVRAAIASLADPRRQAVPSFRGYAYQVRQTVRAWLRCEKGEEIYCELAEDVDKVRRDAQGQIGDVELNQIKYEAGTITLNSAQVVQVMKNFVRHLSKNPGLKIRMRLWTIADRGKEAGSTWGHAENGLDLWEKVQCRESGFDEMLRLLRRFLEENQRLPTEVGAFLTGLSDDRFLNEFVDSIHWDTGQQGYTEIEKEIAKLLSEREPSAIDPDEARRLMDAMYRHVTDLISTDSERALNKEDLERFIAGLRERVVPRGEFRALAADLSGIAARLGGTEQLAVETALALQRMAGQGAVDVGLGEAEVRMPLEPPPLPSLCSKRDRALRELKAQCESTRVVWLHGLNGAGKSTLLNLLVRNLGGPVLWCRLRGLTSFELLSLLRSAALTLEATVTPNLVVLDDVELSSQDTQAMELVQQIASLLGEKNGKLLITSQISAPTRLVNGLYGAITSWSVPGMVEEEIAELLKQSGLGDEEVRKAWTNVIYMRTRGHPQLVSAYIVHGVERKWSIGLSEIFQAPDTAEQVRAKGRQVLAQLGESTQELARRLSVVTGTFTRQFAMDLGTMAAAIADPGGSFDSLVGPWIQAIAKDRFVLSPVLEGYAQASVGDHAVRKYYEIAAGAWLRRRSVTSIDVLQMITVALLAVNEALLLKVCTSLLSEPADRFGLASRELALIVHLDFGQMESEFSVISQFFFRHLQMKIAEQNSDWERYEALDRKLTGLVDSFSSPPLSVFRLAHYVFTNCTLRSPLPFLLRLERAIEARNLQRVTLREDGEVEQTLGKFPCGSLIATAASTVASVEDLERATKKLMSLDEEARKEVGRGFEENPELGLFLTERVWSDESKRAEPRWKRCLEAFDLLTKFAGDAGSNSLRAACDRGSIVLLDEFLDDSEAALRVAGAFRESAKTSVLIDLAEAGVRLRLGEADEGTRLLERVELGCEKSSDPKLYALERAMSLTRALRLLAPTAGKNPASYERMMELVVWGERIGEMLDESALGNLIHIGFQCERGLLLHCMGQPAEAAETIEGMVSELEEFPDQSFSVFRAIRFRVGQCCGLLGSARWKGPDDKFPALSMVGLIADFTDPAPKVLDFPAVSYPELWGILAVYAAHAQNCNVARRCAERALKDGKEAYYVAVSQGVESVFLCDLLENHLDAAFKAGIEWTRVMAIGIAAGLDADDRLRQRMDLDQLFQEFVPRVREVWSNAVVGSVLEPFFMMLCLAEENQRPEIGELQRILESRFGGGASGPFDCLALMEGGLAAADGDELRAVESARVITDDLSAENAERQRLMMLACCASKAFSPAQLVSYQVAMLTPATKMPQSVWAMCFFRMLAKRWLFVIENQKFQLSRPDRSAPMLREAAEKALRSLDVRSCAELLLAATDAAGLSLPGEMGQELGRMAQS